MLVIPFLYYCLIGFSYSACFRRRFSDALAPACIIQILLMLLSGIILGSVSLGILCGVILAIAEIVIFLLRNHPLYDGKPGDSLSSHLLKPILTYPFHKICDNSGFLIFILIFLAIALMNIGKYFHMWDEFTHWGVFIKEMLRTDHLYCASDKVITHGDYVPGIALFETLWERLTFRYQEADAYRAIQLLQMAMLLPLASVNLDKGKSRIRYLVEICCRTSVIIGVPLLFHSFNFYHTIYQDAAVGITLFYCMWLAHAEDFSRYKLWVLTLALSMLLLTKQMAIAFLPTVILYALVRDLLFERKRIRQLWGYLIPTVVPLLIWSAYNRYAGVHAGTGSEGGQGYGGHGLSLLIGVLTHRADIPWQRNFENNYFPALFSGHGVIGKLSFVPLLLILLLLFALPIFMKRKDLGARVRIFLPSLWFLLASIYYIFLFWYLYLTAFNDMECVQLYSFERYMSTISITFVYLLLMVWVTECLPKRVGVRMGAMILLAVLFPLCALFARQGQIGAMLPGFLRGEQAEMGEEAEYLRTHVPSDRSVYVVSRGDRGFGGNVLIYASWPMDVKKASPGPEAFPGDIWSSDISVEEFVDKVTEKDYLWLYQIDDLFKETYSEAFADPSVVVEGSLFEVEEQNGKIVCK